MGDPIPIRPGGGGSNPSGPSGPSGGGGDVPQLVTSLVQSEVKLAKKELETELRDDILNLPTKKEFYGAIIAGLIAAYGIFSIMGDRIESAVDRSATLLEKLNQVAEQGEENASALRVLKNEQEQPQTGNQAR